MGKTDRRNLSTAKRLAEYVAELKARGIVVRVATIEGRKIVLDLSGGKDETVNPADLIDP